MSFVKNAIELLSSPTHSRTTMILIILLILAVIPLTVIISQQQQEIRQRAATSPQCSPPYSGLLSGCFPGQRVCEDANGKYCVGACSILDELGVPQAGCYCYTDTKVGSSCSTSTGQRGTCDSQGECIVSCTVTDSDGNGWSETCNDITRTYKDYCKGAEVHIYRCINNLCTDSLDETCPSGQTCGVQKNGKPVCVAPSVPTSTPIPPTSTPTPVPNFCNCDLNLQTWTSSGACGMEGCPSNKIPQYRSCSPGCRAETRCLADTICSVPSPTSTPTPLPPGVPTPTNTQAPTPFTSVKTDTDCPLKSRGDANCDGSIIHLDFIEWKAEFTKILQGRIVNQPKSDFDNDSQITIIDFNIWRSGFLDPSLKH